LKVYGDIMAQGRSRDGSIVSLRGVGRSGERGKGRKKERALKFRGDVKLRRLYTVE
jgi:hypothetical protein